AGDDVLRFVNPVRAHRVQALPEVVSHRREHRASFLLCFWGRVLLGSWVWRRGFLTLWVFWRCGFLTLWVWLAGALRPVQDDLAALTATDGRKGLGVSVIGKAVGDDRGDVDSTGDEHR